MIEVKKVHLLAVSACILSALCAEAADFYIAPDGRDTNDGSRAAPFATPARARDAVRALKKAGPLPRGGVTVWIGGGFYRFDTTLELGSEDSGTADAPVAYRTPESENAVFHGSRTIDATSFREVDDAPLLARLCPAARGNVLQTVVTDESIAQALSHSNARLSMDGRMMLLAQFPNVGYCHVDEVLDKGAVYAHGRTMGGIPKYSMESPVGGRFTIVEKPSGEWEAEFQRVQKAEVTGYLSYDWYREHHKIAGIRNGTIQLLEYSRYGVLNAAEIPRRVVVRNLLCELDQPGEWYFDDTQRMLFLWPYGKIDGQTNLGVWSGPAFAVLSNTSYVTIRDITVECTASGDGLVVVKGGEHNLVAGCTLRNSTRTGVVLSGGVNNGVVACDLYDLGRHLTLEGGDLKRLAPAGNFARNNHFSQVESRDFYGGIRIRGVGNVFQNNLVHNFVGQPITVAGNDHLFERNELFNVGIEEGDGGAVYAGAQMWSYGNVYRHNFLHHLMCVPQAHPRGGIYPDDLDAGDTIVENVFYKAAHRAVLLNGGAANVVKHNIFINGHIGVYNTEAWANGLIEAAPKYESGELKRGDKMDHVWRTEQVVGKEGWNRPPWSTKYPLFAEVMSQPVRRYYPIENTVSHNLFCGNHQDTAFRRGWGDRELESMEEVDYIQALDNQSIPLDAFVDPICMDLRFKDGRKPKGFPEIPFDRIGLLVDQYRSRIPDKAVYRRDLKAEWDDRKSYDDSGAYDPETVTELIYFNTGKLVLSISPKP